MHNYQKALKNEARVRVASASLLTSISLLLTAFVVSFFGLFFLISGPDFFSNMLAVILYELRADGAIRLSSIYYSNGGEKILLQAHYFDVPFLREQVESLSWKVIVSVIGGALSAGVIHYLYFHWFADKRMERHLRGGELVTHSEMKTMMERIVKREATNEEPIRIADVPIPQAKEKVHYMFAGDTGTGKSQSLMQIMDCVKSRKAKALVWDKSGELVQHYYREGKDIILNPFDDRCPGWSLYSEAEEIDEFESVAESFIPNLAKAEAHSHWSEAAQTVFAWLLYKLKAEKGGGEPSIDDILRTLIDSQTVVEKNALGEDQIVRKRELDRLIRGTLASMVVNPDSPEHASGVIATLVPKIRSLWYLRGLETRPRFSISDWAQNPDDDRWIFIRVNSRQLQSVRPLITAWIDVAIATALTLKKSSDRQIWCFLDELQSLDKLTSLDKGLNEGRKHGLRFVLGFTSVARLYDLYGEKTFKSMVSMCGTKMIYRTSEPDVAEWTSKLLTAREIISERGSVQAGTNNDSTGSTEQREKLALVMADEIQTLPDLNFYMRLPDKYPTAHVVVRYQDRPEIAEPFIKRKLPVEVSYTDLPTPEELMDPPEDEPEEKPKRKSKPKPKQPKQEPLL